MYQKCQGAVAMSELRADPNADTDRGCRHNPVRMPNRESSHGAIFQRQLKCGWLDAT